jgi:hypothetical protein
MVQAPERKYKTVPQVVLKPRLPNKKTAGRSRNKNEIHIQIEIGIPLFGKEIMGYTPSAVQLFVISRSLDL